MKKLFQILQTTTVGLMAEISMDISVALMNGTENCKVKHCVDEHGSEKVPGPVQQMSPSPEKMERENCRNGLFAKKYKAPNHL